MGIVGLITALVALGWPSYASFKAIESCDKSDDTQWLTYWVVYSFFHAAEFFGQFILDWVPLYREVKLLFILWMVLPQFNGATFIYTHYVRRFFMEHGSEIEAAKDRWQEQLGPLTSPENVEQFQRFVQEHGPKAFEMAMRQAATKSSQQQPSEQAATYN